MIMTLKAREVLDDCRAALRMLEDEKDLQRWRITWAATVALLRTVGDVLNKVDGQDKTIKKVSELFFREWMGDSSEHLIFRDFIRLERNNIVHEYRINVHPLEKVSVLVQSLLQPVKGGAPLLQNAVYEIDENIYRPIMKGHWTGDDARDVAREVILWWEKQLSAIDLKISEGSGVSLAQ